MYDYEDFYTETHNEFDKQIDEFKQSLLKAAKQEYVDKMQRLQEENAELQQYKQERDNLKTEHQKALKQLKIKENEVSKKALVRLLENVKVVMWVPNHTRLDVPKCNKCDDNRQLKYTTPRGFPARENCECADDRYHYKPGILIRYEFRQWYNGGEVTARYKGVAKKDGNFVIDTDSSFVKKLWDGVTPFDVLGDSNLMFDNGVDCQKYCDWLNNKERRVKDHQPL